AQTSGTLAPLSGVSFADLSHGWVAGGGNGAPGTILVTSDGGQTWTQQLTDTGGGLVGIAFRDLSHGWAVGYRGTVYATTDGGVTWSPQVSGTPDVQLLGVAFTDDSHGWIVGDSGDRTEA